jgi:hypothetical protein
MGALFAKSALHSIVLTRTLQGFSLEITWINLISTGRTWRNMRAFEFNHELLVGLSIWDL